MPENRRTQSFPLDPEQFGNRYPGKVVRFEEMTASEFDELRRASLSERIGGDARVMYLEAEDLNNPNFNRSTFFLPDTRPVSKWGRFIRSLKENAGIVLKSADELVGKHLWFEEREQDMGSRGRQQVVEVAGALSPDEVESLTGAAAGRRPPAAEEAEETKKAEEAGGYTDESLKEVILSVADGLTRDELAEEIAAMGIGEDSERINRLANGLVAQGKMVLRNRRFQVKEE